MTVEIEGLPASVRGALRESYRAEAPLAEQTELPSLRLPNLRSESSTTVFSGQPDEWAAYLNMSKEQRYEPDLGVRVALQPAALAIAFEAINADSQWLAGLLRRGYDLARRGIAHKPNVVATFDQLLFARRVTRPIVVHSSPTLPSLGTREMEYPHAAPCGEVRIVLHSRYLQGVRETLDEKAGLSDAEQLGVCWSLVSRFVSQLAFPDLPRDRFVAKIDVFAKMSFVAINLLYEESRSGRLIPTAAGATYEALLSEASDIPRGELCDRHPYFRMLARLNFMLRAKPYVSYEGEARIAAREYLDATYLRLSLAGAMPMVPPMMRPMEFTRKGSKVKVASPQVGYNGVLDEDDLEAWKKIRKPFRKLGFTLLRQLGMGDFGRVYEVLNDNNPAFPARVALKVDRLVGKKKHAILEAEQAFRIGSELASAPHLVRLYDTGTLPDERFTYHVLQLVDGDTLDNLIGVAGAEHASVSGESRSGRTEADARREYERAIRRRSGQAWRRARMGLPFRFALSPAMILDMLTSVLLSLEEVHHLGYAINDLKNDNLMMSRRGQVKGIDLDSYAPVRSDADKIVDFMFLSGSLILLFFNAAASSARRELAWEALTQDESLLRRELDVYWPLGDVELLSEGRVSKAAVTEVLVDLVLRSRGLVYAKKPDIFAADIVRLIDVKRGFLVEDLVID